MCCCIIFLNDLGIETSDSLRMPTNCKKWRKMHAENNLDIKSRYSVEVVQDRTEESPDDLAKKSTVSAGV